MEEMIFEDEQHYGQISDVLKKKIAQTPTIYRLTGARRRIYFTKEHPSVPAVVYNSGTTLIDNYRDKEGEEALHKWKVDLVNKGLNPSEVVKTRQDYGTLLHILYGKIFMGEKVSFLKLKDFLISLAQEARMNKEYLTNLVSSHIEEFQKDLASFLVWIKDYNVEPLAVELMVKSDKWKVATALDLVCYMTIKEKGFFGEVYKTGERKGEPKETYSEVRKLVLVDFKSGKKGFYKKNVLQLLLSKEIFEENFSDMKIEGIFNFAPNDWRNEPTYRCHDQERDSSQNIVHLKRLQTNVFERGLIEFEDIISHKKTRVIKGDVDFKKINEFNTSDLVSYLTLQEVADMYYTLKYTEVDYFAKLIEDNNITNQIELRVVLNKMGANELKDLAKVIGINYTKKQEFIKKLTQKYLDGKGKDTPQES